MDELRRRIPFKVVDEDDGSISDNVLDEEQQDAVIEDLKKENESVNVTYHTALKVILALSATLQLVGIVQNPLHAIAPTQSTDTPLPLSLVFTILALFAHFNLALTLWSDEARVQLQLSHPPTPLSYQMLYSLSAVAPTLSFFLGKPWQTTVWWCNSAFMVFIFQTIMDTIQASDQSISELEDLKYHAPGA